MPLPLLQPAMVGPKNVNHEPADRSSITSRRSSNNMAIAEPNNILKLVAFGTRLSLALYEFSASVPTATNYVSKLAKEVNLLALELRQVAILLPRDRNFLSYDANRTVSEILAQSQAVFQEVEATVPVKAARYDRGAIMDGGDNTVSPSSWEWNENTMLKASYLLGHLDGLKSTLSVLLQCLHVAKIIMWSRNERTQNAWNTVDTERIQFQSLIIDQQMALIRVNRLYREYSLSKSAFLELLPSPSHHQMFTQRDEREIIHPMALVRYQEPSLSQPHPANTEIEDLARVHRVAQPYVDMLLHRWTRLEEMESRQLEGSGSSRRSSAPSDRGRWEHPTVESDSEDEFGSPQDSSRRLNGPGPVLMPVHEDEDADVELGLPIRSVGITPSPAINVHRSSIPHNWSSPSSSSSASANLYFPASPPPAGTNSLPRSHASSSPGTSMFAEQYTPRPRHPSPPSTNSGPAAASSSPPRQEIPEPQNIPWRLRLNNIYWDHNGATITNSNTRGSHLSALKDRNTVTEILASYVVREALEEAALSYRSVNRDSFDGRKTRFESCFVIQQPMGWEEVRRLVARSEVLRRKREGEEGGEQRRRRREKGGGPLYVQPPHPPPLDRRNSLPVGVGVGGGLSSPTAAQHTRHNGRERLTPRSSPENTSEDGEETKRSPYRRASISTGNAKKERRKSAGGNSIATLGTGVAAGAGLAALLSDLAEGLGGL